MLATIVAVESIVNRGESQGWIARAFFVQSICLTGRADRIDAIGKRKARPARRVIEDGNARVIRNVRRVSRIAGGCGSVAGGIRR